ncbi:hypothetical protein QYS62_009884 [Fusarium acuminatum]|uniref:Uncharacterized protein n=1 Tax=Fusarium acuminatum TaxID=5515 RepID=A0ABZ2X6S7_9HYPO
MSYHSDPFAGQSGRSLPPITQGDGDMPIQHPAPLYSNPPFGMPSFQPQPVQSRGTGSGYHSESALQVNGNLNSWVPTAQQALDNALQASGFTDMQHQMRMFSPQNGLEYGVGAPLAVPPNSPVEGAAYATNSSMPSGHGAPAP